MNKKEFMQKFLPNYEAKRKPIEIDVKEYFARKGNADSKFIADVCDSCFFDEHFLEALRNFAKKLCKKQKEYCYDVYSYSDPGETCSDILRAKQPKIEEL
jgi:hypothetical protein